MPKRRGIEGCSDGIYRGNWLPIKDYSDRILLDGADAKRTRVVGGNGRSHSREDAGGEEIGLPRRPIMRQ